MHLNGTYRNSRNRKQNKVCVTLDSELYKRKPVLTYAISGNVVGGVGEFGEFNFLSSSTEECLTTAATIDNSIDQNLTPSERTQAN